MPAPVASTVIPATSRGVRIDVLGGLRIRRHGVDLDAGPRQQALLLVVLAARVGRPVSTSDLVRALWGAEPPRTASNVLHKYIGAVRRILEPDLLPRQEGSFLRRRADGYVFTATGDVLDLSRFRELVAAGARADEQDAVMRYTAALEVWRGRTGEGFAHGVDSAAVCSEVDREFQDACVTGARLAVAAGRADQMIPAITLAASLDPMNEAVHAALIDVMVAAGRQAEAVAVFHRIREHLAAELGIDPGGMLEAAYRRAIGSWRADVVRIQTSAPSDLDASIPLVGRTTEQAALARALARALDGGGGSVLIEGEPGSGKSRLMDEFANHAISRGVSLHKACCVSADGAPTMWPWIGVLRGLVDSLPPADRAVWRAGRIGTLIDTDSFDLVERLRITDDGFRLIDEILTLVECVAARNPLVILIDDLHWADARSLEVLERLIDRGAPALIVGSFRNRAPRPGPSLLPLLAIAARTAQHERIRLRPLTVGETLQILQSDYGDRLQPGDAMVVTTRSGGNPFFAHELARCLADRAHGALTPSHGVPVTIRDVVDARVRELPDDARTLVQLASVIGRTVSISLVAAAAGQEVPASLQAVESAADLGLVDVVAPELGTFCFSHDLIRESILDALSPRELAGLHVRVADALEADTAALHSPEQLAHHLWSAGVLADPNRSALAMVRSARRQIAVHAFEDADRQLQRVMAILG